MLKGDVDDYLLEYNCEVNEAGDGGEWKWEGGDAYDSDHKNEAGLLIDFPCNAKPLVLKSENYNQEGLLISCTFEPVKMGDGEGDENKIDGISIPTTSPYVPAENHCLVFCDLYKVS